MAALADLVEIRRHVARDDPGAASSLGQRLREAPERLLDHPASGRPGRLPETRELVLGGTPYLLPHRVRGAEIHILRVLHGAQVWPDAV